MFASANASYISILPLSQETAGPPNDPLPGDEPPITREGREQSTSGDSFRYVDMYIGVGSNK